MCDIEHYIEYAENKRLASYHNNMAVTGVVVLIVGLYTIFITEVDVVNISAVPIMKIILFLFLSVYGGICTLLSPRKARMYTKIAAEYEWKNSNICEILLQSSQAATLNLTDNPAYHQCQCKAGLRNNNSKFFHRRAYHFKCVRCRH